MLRNYKIWFLPLVWSLLQVGSAVGQTPDSLNRSNFQSITDKLEDAVSGNDLALDFSDLTDDYVYYFKNRLNLNNQDDIEKLIELGLLNRLQADNLRVYILKYGYLQSVYELKYIEGFNGQTLEKLLPFVKAVTPVKRKKVRSSEVLKYGRHQIIARFGSLLQQPAGYLFSPDTALFKPGSAYLGNRFKYYLRYGFDYQKKFRAGVTLEKDAGEPVSTAGFSDTLKQMIAGKVSPVFDFYSAFLYASDMGFVKKIAIGDYHLEFGQGLTLWSGITFGFSSDVTAVKRYGRGIRPNTSVNENRFFRGAAVETVFGKMHLFGFYSHNKVDGNLSEVFDTISIKQVSGLQETGNHRTINELIDKRSVDINIAGGRVQFKGAFFSTGVTLYRTFLNPPLVPDSAPYRYFRFRGDRLTIYGIDLNAVTGKWEWFGEFSGNLAGGGEAGIIGVNGFLNDRFTVTAYYRNIGKSFHNLFYAPLAESSNPVGESGWYLGVSALLNKQVSVNAYADYFNYSWLRYRVDALSSGKGFLFQLNYLPVRNISSYFRFRYKIKQENNDADWHYLSPLSDVIRSEWRWNVQWQLCEDLLLKSRIEYVLYNKERVHEKGFLFYQDILFRPLSFPLQAVFRYAMFDTDGWNSRIYAYESDVLYSFTVPAYYDKGRRVYLMLRWQATGNLVFWFRYAQTFFYNKTVIGNGPDAVTGNHKSDVKVQMIWKL